MVIVRRGNVLRPRLVHVTAPAAINMLTCYDMCGTDALRRIRNAIGCICYWFRRVTERVFARSVAVIPAANLVYKLMPASTDTPNNESSDSDYSVRLGNTLEFESIQRKLR